MKSDAVFDADHSYCLHFLPILSGRAISTVSSDDLIRGTYPGSLKDQVRPSIFTSLEEIGLDLSYRMM